MRAFSQQLVPGSLWRSVAWLCVVLPLLACPPTPATVYDAGTPITQVSITNPTANEVWLAGSDHVVTCTTSTDTDLACDGAGWYPVNDSVTHYWTGTGTFKNNIIIGTSVTYICTTTAGTNVVYVYADDNYSDGNPAHENPAVVNETASTDNETLSVVIPQLQWVEFTGLGKHLMHKKDANPWDPQTENYGTDYAFPVPNRAWVRGQPRQEPVCYTMNGTGAQVKASINFTTSVALTESSTVKVSCHDGIANAFSQTGVSVSGTSTTVPPMNYAATLANSIGYKSWQIRWQYWVPTGAWTYITVGTSANTQYRTWGTPGGGGTVTAKRVKWACEAANDKATITLAAEKVADRARTDARFAWQQLLNEPIWKALDPTGYMVDCGEGAKLAVFGLSMLGVPGAQQDFAYPTGGIPEGDKDASSQETTTCSNPAHGTIYLRYDQTTDGYLNNYEGCFKVADQGVTKYLTVWERGPTVADPYGLLKILNQQANLTQWWSYGSTTRVKDTHDHPNPVPLPAP